MESEPDSERARAIMVSLMQKQVRVFLCILPAAMTDFRRSRSTVSLACREEARR
jgi:hypothetical protein